MSWGSEANFLSYRATMSKTEINEHQRLISGSLERAKSLVDSSLLDITFMQPALPGM